MATLTGPTNSSTSGKWWNKSKATYSNSWWATTKQGLTVDKDTMQKDANKNHHLETVANQKSLSQTKSLAKVKLFIYVSSHGGQSRALRAVGWCAQNLR